MRWRWRDQFRRQPPSRCHRSGCGRACSDADTDTDAYPVTVRHTGPNAIARASPFADAISNADTSADADAGSHAASAATLGWSKGHTDVRLSMVDEDGTVMGTPTGSGALRLGRGATTAMVEAHRSFDFGFGWSVKGYGSLG